MHFQSVKNSRPVPRRQPATCLPWSNLKNALFPITFMRCRSLILSLLAITPGSYFASSPAVDSISVPSPVYQNESIRISASVSDPSGYLDEVEFEYQWSVPGTGWSSWMDIGSTSVADEMDVTISKTWTPTLLGNHRIKVTVTDEDGTVAQVRPASRWW